MKTENLENINEAAIMETLGSNPSDLRVCAIGDKKRYNANKLLLGDNCRYEKDGARINKENTDIVVICGEYAPPPNVVLAVFL
jgi:phage gp45-like